MSDLIAALQIFLKYGDERNPTGCEHDEFRVYVLPAAVSDEDKAALAKLSFQPDEDTESFISYRFGSA